MPETIEARLSELGLTLPDAPSGAANYVPTMIAGNFLHVSGQLSVGSGDEVKGRLGESVSLEDGQKAAQLACLNILAQAKAALGSLDRIKQTVRLTGYVHATQDFMDHPKVVNGASDLMVAALGDKGKHTRAAVGVASLPFGVAVEVDAIFAIE